MTRRHQSIRLGLGVGGFGVLTNALTVLLLFTLPQHLLGEKAGEAFLENWFGLVSTVGVGLAFYVTPVLAGLAAFYLVYAAEAPVRSALVGLAVGSLLFGIAVTLTGWAITGPMYRSSPIEYAGQTVRFVLRFLGPAVAGALAGTVLGNRG